MTLFSCKGVKGAGIIYKGASKYEITEVEGIIYDGQPEQKYFYIYSLPSQTFKNYPKGTPQWVSLKAIKPIGIEKLHVKDYQHFVRKANIKEKKEWASSFRTSAKKKL